MRRPDLELDVKSYYTDKRDEEIVRGHLGASIIGHICERHIQYSWRKADVENLCGRKLKLFETGHREEALIGDILKARGHKLFTVDPKTGEQFKIYDETGHFRGSVDGIFMDFKPKSERGLKRQKALFECKTHNENNWNKLVRNGVQLGFPSHYAQIQTYMGSLELGYCGYYALNKNNDDIYVEEVPFNKGEYIANGRRARRIIDAETLLPRISRDCSRFECKHMCSFRSVCLKEKPPLNHCRMCKHSRPAMGGKWGCIKWEKELSFDEQLTIHDCFEEIDDCIA